MKATQTPMISLDRKYGCQATFSEPDRYREITSLSADRKWIAQGAGVSYVPASFGEEPHVVGMKRFNRILSWDQSKALVEVEAGLSIGDLQGFLWKKGYYIKSLPGHPQITVGGCIACNIFGKNQFKEGLFDEGIEDLTIYHPTHGLKKVSRGSDPEVFALTCGGFGLTGVVIKATLRVALVPGRQVMVRHLPVENLAKTYSTMKDEGPGYDLLYSWNDLSPGASGKGFLVLGRWDSGAQADGPLTFQPLSMGKKGMMKYLPVLTPWMNRTYFALQTRKNELRPMSFWDFSFPVANKVWYFDAFGMDGFYEFQILIPEEQVDSYLKAFYSLQERFRPNIVLTSCKLFQGQPRYLNFNGQGMVLSLDLPATGRDFEFCQALHRLNVEMKCRDNVCKNSSLDRSTVEAQYGGLYTAFREGLKRYDPDRLFVSHLSERLGL